MLQKFLLIGVGGSGGKTLRYTWRELDRRLRATGWTEGVPDGWAFLHIDVPHRPDVVERDVPAQIGDAARYLGLADESLPYSHYDQILTSQADLLNAIVGWRPNPSLDYTPPFKGAGQKRVVGRVVTLTQLTKVGAALDSAVHKLGDAEVTAQMARLNAHLQLTDVQNQTQPTAIVISSLGGGAGSGAFLDVIELLLSRATDNAQWLAMSLVTVLYAADVFQHLSAQERPGVEANTLAALSELLSAFEHRGSVPEVEDRLLDPGGGVVPVRNRRIGRTNFIIGAKNVNVTFNSSLDVFRSVGKAFAAFMTVNEVQHEFSTYVQGNPSAPAVSHAFRITDSSSTDQPCTSFGYANVTLGRSLFAQYATERLAKRAVKRLLHGHKEGVKPGDLRSDEALIDERAEDIKESFFDDCQLWELSRSHNQVLDALRDNAAKEQALDDFVSRMQQRQAGHARAETPLTWFTEVHAVFEALRLEFEAAESAERIRRATEWVAITRQRVLRTTASYAGTYGLLVTVALIERLRDQLSSAADELDHESHESLKEDQGLTSRAQQLFQTIREKTIAPSHRSFKDSRLLQREAVRRRTEAELYAFTSRLLRDLARNFLPGLREALLRAGQDLGSSERKAHQNLLSQWSLSAVPAHLRPAPNELLLDEADRFPDEFMRLLKEAFGIDAAENAESAALEELISGAWPAEQGVLRDPEEQHLIEVRRDWQPTISDALAPGAAGGSAAFAIELDATTLHREATAWVRGRRGRFSEYVHASLADWLSPSEQDATARAGLFADRFEQALGLAEPLVSTNAELHQIVHNAAPARPKFVISHIPIGDDHAAAARVRAQLAAAGLNQSAVDGAFNPNARAGEVEISSFVGQSVHPIVFDSLMRPVQSDWQQRTDNGSRRQFWQFQRSRTLRSFVPLSPRRQQLLVRGWLVATLLGHIPILQGPWSENPLDVWTPSGRRRFPRYLLGRDVAHQGSVLPALMESMPLALLTFASGSRTELEAYMRLLDLGETTQTSSNGRGHDTSPFEVSASYDANAELAAWILHATPSVPDPGFEPPPAPRGIAGPPDGTAEERARSMADALRKYDTSYRSVSEQRITRETTLTAGTGWEIREFVHRATSELIREIELVPAQADLDDLDGLGVPG